MLHDSEQVEASLLKRGLGFYIPETKAEKDGNGNIIKAVTGKRYYSAEVMEINTSLNNRRLDRGKQKQEVTGANGGPITIQLTETDKG